jgi:hypothetical protein
LGAETGKGDGVLGVAKLPLVRFVNLYLSKTATQLTKGWDTLNWSASSSTDSLMSLLLGFNLRGLDKRGVPHYLAWEGYMGYGGYPTP